MRYRVPVPNGRKRHPKIKVGKKYDGILVFYKVSPVKYTEINEFPVEIDVWWDATTRTLEVDWDSCDGNYDKIIRQQELLQQLSKKKLNFMR